MILILTESTAHSFSLAESGSIEAKPKIVSPSVLRPTSIVMSDDLPAITELLTERELEVLNLLTVGAANGDIAVQLVISPNTVKKHISSILSKLGVLNRTQAVYLARQLNLILA